MAGLWSHRSTIRISNPDSSSWGYRTAEVPDGPALEALDIPEILREFNQSHIDLLKVDIEGAECEVFSNSRSWIDRVRVIVIELHDRFRPGCTEAVEEAVRDKGFVRTSSGECLVLTRQHNGDADKRLAPTSHGSGSG
jgi:hypothetical protein